MKQGRLPVTVREGTFPSELAVSFEAAGQHYNMIVDREDVEDGKLTVYIVARGEKDAIIDLPRETFTSGARIRVPAELVQPA